MKNNIQIVFTIFLNHGFRMSKILLILRNRLEDSDDFMNGQELHSNYFNLFGESKQPACISTASCAHL
jgi:intergrase/recombinase